MQALCIEVRMGGFIQARDITHASVGIAGKAAAGVDADRIGGGDVTHGMLPGAQKALKRRERKNGCPAK